MSTTLLDALGLLAGFDASVAQVVALSLLVSGSAVILGVLIGLPLGAFVAIARFPRRGAVTVLLNGMMGLPPYSRIYPCPTWAVWIYCKRCGLRTVTTCATSPSSS